MKFVLLALCLFAFLSPAFADVPAIDRPARVKGMQDLISLAKSLKEETTVEQGVALSDAISFVQLALKNHLRPSADAEEQDRVVTAMFDGKTPREIIVIGQFCRVAHHSAYAIGLSRGSKIGKETADDDVRRSEVNAQVASKLLRDYLGMANQASVPTATSVTPAADAPVAPAATAAHL